MTITELKKINFSLILLSLLPIAFVVGPLIVELIINILILIFLYQCAVEKKFKSFDNKIFYFFIFFYLFLIIDLLISDFFSESAINIISYIRFFIFPFAICEILKKNDHNLKYVFIIFLLTIFIVVLDGYFQFITDKNIVGYEKYRIDRISGFFKEDLILGSYLSRLLPLFIGLILYFNDKSKLSYLSLSVFFLAFILIFLTGERASFLTASLALIIILIQIKSYFFLRILLTIGSIFIISLLMFFNPIMFDRHFKQMKNHIIGYSSQDIILPNYMPMFKTAYKMFEENKLFGMGPKSYRYLCSDKRFITYFPHKEILIDNTIVKIKISWKELRQLHLKKFYVSEGDIIIKNDKLFSFGFHDEDKTYFYFSDKEGLIKKIYKKDKYSRNNKILDIIPQVSPETEYIKKNSCNTHPHNFYIQLLAETGFIGFIFIFSLFVYLFYLLAKNYFFKLFKNKEIFSDSELCIIVGFFVVLWPLTTNGNFFNNWINLISFYPLGFLLYMLTSKQKKK